jgi:transcriptional regulator with XRE-family HTH domain
MEHQANFPNPSSSPYGVGDELRAAREAQGLTLGDISARTRVAERHLISIEENRFAQLAAPTYAVGFSRAYARAVGLDEAEVAIRVRRQLDAQPNARPAPLPSFEPGDPARVPPSRIAWLAGLCAVVVVGLLVVYWTSFLSPEGALPSLLPNGTQGTAPRVAAAPAKPAGPSAPVSGPVVLTANAPRVWVKVTDAAGNQLFQKELAQGESWTVPAEAQGPQLRTARPDQLQITVAGRAIAPLGDKPEVISGVLLTPAALIARGTATGARASRAPAPAPPPSPAQDNPLSTTAQ